MFYLYDSSFIRFLTNSRDGEEFSRDRMDLLVAAEPQGVYVMACQLLLNGVDLLYHLDFSKNVHVDDKSLPLCGGENFSTEKLGYSINNIKCRNKGNFEKKCECPDLLSGEFCQTCNCGNRTCSIDSNKNVICNA